MRSPPLRAPRRVAWLPGGFPADRADELIELLERDLAPHLQPMRSTLPDPRESRSNYGELLTKVMRNRTTVLGNPRSNAYRAARDNGLLALLQSSSTKQLAEHVSGLTLRSEVGCQIIRYGPGDYVGPHHDAHPESTHLRDGYVDLHISLPTRSVRSQLLVVEQSGHLDRVIDIGAAPGITVSVLPTWHQVTPLVAKRDRENPCRWLLLTSFEVDPSR